MVVCDGMLRPTTRNGTSRRVGEAEHVEGKAAGRIESSVGVLEMTSDLGHDHLEAHHHTSWFPAIGSFVLLWI